MFNIIFYEDKNGYSEYMFRKKTNKTPKAEIKKAINECKDYKSRNGEH